MMRVIKIGIASLWVLAAICGVRELMQPPQYADAMLPDPTATALYITAGECAVFRGNGRHFHAVDECEKYNSHRERIDYEVQRPLRFK